MSNNFVKKLYDIAESKDENGMNKFDEQKLRRYLDNNKSLMSRNKDTFEKEEERFSTCMMYNPCPICDKCLNKASHLYLECQLCNIPICTHTYKDRAKMIIRKNFATKVSTETYNKFLKVK